MKSNSARLVTIIFSFLSCNKKKETATHSSTLAWKTHGWRSIVGYGPWGRKESDTTDNFTFTFM